MKIPAKLMTAAAGTDRRIKPRHLLLIEVAISVGQQGTDALVHDLSTTGLRIETDDPLDVGEQLTIELMGGTTIEATVVWSSDRSYGCRFASSVPQGVIGAILLQAPIDLPSSVPTRTIEEVELESGLDILRLAKWYEDFQKRRSSSGEQLVGFRKVDDHIVALISRLS